MATSWKRKMLNPIQDALGVDVVRHGRAAVTVEKQYLRRFLAEFQIDCVFDVGANEGQYAEMLREVGYGGAIVSFEPIPAMLPGLKGKAARDANWFVEGVALDEEPRDAVFNVTAHSEFSSLRTPSTAETGIFAEQNKTTTRVELRTETLGPHFRTYQERLGFSRPFLKLDTQGNDLRIVRGGRDVIGEFYGLQSELAIKKLYEDQPSYIDSIRYYESLGFQLGALVPNNAGQFPLLYEIDCIMVSSRLVALLGRH